jgi:uncharacterized protein YdiU (UPF0061 family)
LKFDNRFVTELPGESMHSPRPRQVVGACWSPVTPTAVRQPKLIAASQEVADLLGLSADALARQDMVDVLGGNGLLPGMQPYSACYGGHQFGNWAGQ